MPKFSLDLSGVSESIRVEPGNYQAVIGKTELVDSADKQSHNIRWSFTISEGPQAGTPMVMFSSLKPTNLWRLKGILRNLGFNVDEAMNIEVDEETGIIIQPEFVGLPCTLSIVDDTYNGVLRSAVSEVLEAGEAPVTIPTKSTSGKMPAVGGLKLK